MAQAFDPYHKWLGIPRAEQPPNHYRLLGLTVFESDRDAILSAAEQRIAHVRTFQISEHAEASQRFLNELAASRVCLLKPQEKARYDTGLRAAIAPSGAPPHAGLYTVPLAPAHVAAHLTIGAPAQPPFAAPAMTDLPPSPQISTVPFSRAIPVVAPLRQPDVGKDAAVGAPPPAPNTATTYSQSAKNRYLLRAIAGSATVIAACAVVIGWSVFHGARRKGHDQPGLDLAVLSNPQDQAVVARTVKLNSPAPEDAIVPPVGPPRPAKIASNLRGNSVEEPLAVHPEAGEPANAESSANADPETSVVAAPSTPGKPTTESPVGIDGEDNAIDLLKLIDLNRDVTDGDWRFEDGVLRVNNPVDAYGGPSHAALNIPCSMPKGTYAIRMQAKRVDPAHRGGITAQFRGVEVYMSGGQKRSVVDDANGSRVLTADFFPTLEASTVTFAVRPDDLSITSSSGASLSARIKTRDSDRLFFVVYGLYEISELTLVTRSDSAGSLSLSPPATATDGNGARTP